MPDWSKSMQQTYEYFEVDPGTWRDKTQLKNVKSSTITRDTTVETLGSATIDVTETIGEAYIRTYLKTIQNGVTERVPLGTHLVQTPKSAFNGKSRTVTMDAYTPLIELKENQPPLGYYTPEGANILDAAYDIITDHARAPVVKTSSDKKLPKHFVADPNDTWLSYVIALLANANYVLDLDPMGYILFAPKQETAAMQPVWTYTDDNSSILHPDINMEHDLYNIPNVVEVIYADASNIFTVVVRNDDENSPTSTINRGREIKRRVQNPSFSGAPSKAQVEEYANQLLKELSSLEYKISYTHGYCPARTDDCVMMDYTASGITDTKARVISQTIKCVPGCPVTETSAFTNKLWG